ncbi:ABC transporter ATP-binding protein [Clostridium sp. JS66]|uniref:ABC transporter ATP-binding protein n=1 Tax=Clostridium sp. JS66 TaxID=3064705 RepID=UPI00298E7D21|nr:ABC transporter ATP-binding protein [Clostridium sp. JS66]WPC43434.1 ABC transporter ATP-binding protein [Clostridium sp. JS66]
MFRIIKRLPAGRVTIAIAFLLLQVACAMYLPYMTADMVNNGVIKGDIGFIWRQGGLMIGLTLIGLVGQVLNPYVSSKIAFNFAKEIRREIYGKVLSFSKNEYDKFGAVTLITRNTNDVTQVQSLVEMGLKFMIVSPLYLIGGIAMTYKLSPKLSLVFVAVIPFLILGSVIIYKFANPLYGKIQILLDRLNLYFREGLTGVKVIRAFGKEEEEYEKYSNTNMDYTRTVIKAGTIMSFFSPLITFILSLTTIIIMWIGAGSIMSGTMEVGTIMATITYSAQILLGFAIITSVILVIPRGQISINRIYEILDMPLSIQNLDTTVAPLNGSVQFDHVDFRYPNAKKKTLENINFKITRGQTLAIIGSTGDGKTSLVNLIARFYDVEKGSVKIGGIDIREIELRELNDRVSFTTQKSTLFMGTIRENLQMAKPNATDEEIWVALELACASEFVSKLEGGLDSVIEKNGGNFSGGQKQRICIARTLLKDADIYIFDDSFSALDFKTDAAVRSSMKKKLSNSVTVIVAQRVSTIMNANLIAVLDKGKLAGLGTHEELLASNPVYQEIVNSQTYKEEIA